MTPDTLASILDANPYPGCVVTRADDALRLDFDGLILFYRADGWQFDKVLLESKLDHFDPVKPSDVFTEIRRILKTVFAIKVGAALSEAEALRSVDPIEYLTEIAAEKMLSILDVAALASARQTEIDRGVKAHTASARDAAALIAGMERDLSDKDAALKTAHAALKRICEVIDAPAPACPDDAVEAVKGLIGAADGHYRRADRAEEALAEMVKALDDAGAPGTYDDGGEIGGAARIRLLGDRWRAERDEWQVEATHAAQRLDAIRDAHEALDERGVPRQAGLVKMTPAARIRAIPR